MIPRFDFMSSLLSDDGVCGAAFSAAYDDSAVSMKKGSTYCPISCACQWRRGELTLGAGLAIKPLAAGSGKVSGA
jgi:hypothetical protein